MEYIGVFILGAAAGIALPMSPQFPAAIPKVSFLC